MHDSTPMLLIPPGERVAIPVGICSPPSVLCPTQHKASPDQNVLMKTLFRFYNPSLGIHFYTTNPQETASLPGGPSWYEECALGYIYRKNVPHTVKVYIYT